jgi:hypothetical protein
MTQRFNGRFERRLAVIGVMVVALSAFAGPSQAQFFGDRFYGGDGGYGGGYYGSPRYQRPREDFSFPFGDRFMRPAPPPADYSKAPPPRKLESPPSTTIVVIGDSMADWLAYGLDETYSDQPDTGVVRKIKAYAGLIHYDAKNENLDWSQAVKDALNGEKPNAIVVMLGLNDRVPLRERARPAAPRPDTQAKEQLPQGQGQGQGQTSGPTPNQVPGQATNQAAGQAQAQTQSQRPPATQQTSSPQPSVQDTEAGPQNGASSEAPRPGSSYEFHTDKWAELYGRRVDEMIAALKSRGVPVLWVGLPALRGTKSTSDMAYLDEIYRERAEKAGITYVDIWDGFVDDQGRYTVQGPDFEGQTRRLRTADGVHFTKAGAVKLASYVDQELRRVISSHATPVALPGPDAAPKPAVGTHPDIGPVMPLAATASSEGGDLLGASRPTQATLSDPLAAKVLNRGDPIPAPAGRADDFSWPRRGGDANAAAIDVAPQPAPGPAAPAAGPSSKKADKSDGKKTADTKAGEGKSKPASDQGAAKSRRSSGASLDGAPRPPRDVGGGR